MIVHLVDDDQYPHRLADDVEEERRLLHVAVTRARRHATIVTGRRPSPFIAELTTEPPAELTSEQPVGAICACNATRRRRAASSGGDHPLLDRSRVLAAAGVVLVDQGHEWVVTGFDDGVVVAAQGSATRRFQVGTQVVTAGRQRGALQAPTATVAARVGVGLRRAATLPGGRPPGKAGLRRVRRQDARGDRRCAPGDARRSRPRQGRGAVEARTVRRCGACSSGVGYRPMKTGVNTPNSATIGALDGYPGHVFGGTPHELRPTLRGWLHASAFFVAIPAGVLLILAANGPTCPRRGIRVRGDGAAAVRYIGRLPHARPVASGARHHAAPRPFDDLPADHGYVRSDVPRRPPTGVGDPAARRRRGLRGRRRRAQAHGVPRPVGRARVVPGDGMGVRRRGARVRPLPDRWANWRCSSPADSPTRSGSRC